MMTSYNNMGYIRGNLSNVLLLFTSNATFKIFSLVIKVLI